jgi:hypothetical protein
MDSDIETTGLGPDKECWSRDRETPGGNYCPDKARLIPSKKAVSHKGKDYLAEELPASQKALQVRGSQ